MKPDWARDGGRKRAGRFDANIILQKVKKKIVFKFEIKIGTFSFSEMHY